MKYILCIVWALKYVFILESIRKKINNKNKGYKLSNLGGMTKTMQIILCKSYILFIKGSKMLFIF